MKPENPGPEVVTVEVARASNREQEELTEFLEERSAELAELRPSCAEMKGAAALKERLEQADQSESPFALLGLKAEAMALFTEWVEARRSARQPTAKEYRRRVRTSRTVPEKQRILWHAYESWRSHERAETLCLARLSASKNVSLFLLTSWMNLPDRPPKRSAEWLSECSQLGGGNAWAKRCVQRTAELKRKEQEARRAKELYEYQGALKSKQEVTVASNQARPLLAESQPAPCTFRGHTDEDIAWQAAGGEGIATPGGADVAQLELPKTAEGQAQATLEWPIVGTFTINPRRRFLWVETRIDFIPGHVWLDQGVLVRATLAGAGTANVFMPTDFLLPAPGPAQADCHKLTLKRQASQERPSPKAVLLDWSQFPLFVRPGGKSLGELRGEYVGQVLITARRGDLVQVSSLPRAPYGFRGWVPKSAIQGMGVGGLGLASDDSIANFDYVVNDAIAVRFEADPKAPIIGALPRGQHLRLWTDHGTIVGVKAIGAYPSNESGEFFVLRTELEQRSRVIGTPTPEFVAPAAR